MAEFVSITEVDFSQDDDYLIQLSQLKEEKENLYSLLHSKDKEINEYKRKSDDQEISINHHKKMMKNQEALLSFYKTQAESHSSSEDSTAIATRNKELEMKLISLEEANITLQTKTKQLQSNLDALKAEKSELAEMKDNMISMLSDKEMEILELRTKISDYCKKYNIKEEEEDNSSLKEDEDRNDNSSEGEVNRMKKLYDELELEYEEYRLKSQSELDSLRNENKDLISKDRANLVIIRDLESEMASLKEEMVLLDIEKEKCENQSIHLSTAQRHNMEYINEIDALQTQIRDLKQLNESLVSSIDAHKSTVRLERNELEELYCEVKKERNELEEQLSRLRETAKADYYSLQEKSMKEINEKNAFIGQLHEIISKKDQDMSQLLIEREKSENEYKSKCNTLLYKATKFEEEKVNKDKKMVDLSVKADIERNTLLLKIKELNNKNESLSNRLDSLSNGFTVSEIKETSISMSNVFFYEENGNTLIRTPEDEVLALKEEIETKNKAMDAYTHEKKYYEKRLNDLKQSLSKSTNDRLIAEKDYLQKENEALSLQIEVLTSQRERDNTSHLTEVSVITNEVIKAKVSLAALSYEKDKEQLKYRNYMKKIKAKLQSIGVTMRNKKKA